MIEPRHEKTCLQSCVTRSSRLQKPACIIEFLQLMYYVLSNEGTDQTAQMARQICIFVVHVNKLPHYITTL